MISLRVKSLMVIGAMAALFMALLMVQQRHVIERSVKAVEAGVAQKVVGTVLSSLDTRISKMERSVIDYANWSETWRYMAGENPSFAERNLTTQAIEAIDLNAVILLDSQGQFHSGHVYGFNSDLVGPKGEGLWPNGVAITLGKQLEVGRGHIAGLVQTVAGTAIFSAAQVTNQYSAGEPNGIMVFLELIENYEDRVASGLMIDLTIRNANGLTPLSHEQQGLAVWPHNDTYFETMLLQEMIAKEYTVHRLVLNDFLGEPAVDLRIERSVVFSALANQITLEFVFPVIIFLIVLSLAIYWIFSNRILNPINVFTDTILQNRHKEVIQPLEEGKTDSELNRLARSFNELMADLEFSRQELIAEKEKAESAIRSKTEFLANVNHEIRTPLNAIIGFADIILSSEDDTKSVTGRYAEIILSSGQHLLEVLKDVLDISRMEAATMALDFEHREIASLLTVPCGEAEVMCKKKNITLVEEISEDLELVYTNEGAFEQILANLLSNAVKFSPEGETIIVSVEDIDNATVIKVKDCGIGIAKKDRKRIIHPFEQVSESLDRKQEGTGLGLSIVNGLVQIHGGTLSLQSELGVGTEFIVTLPHRPDTEVENAPRLISVSARAKA